MLGAVALLGSSWYRPAYGWPKSRGSAVATRVSPHALATDGSCDEPAWATARAQGAFVQRQPLDGHAPTEATHVRFAYDDDALHLCVELGDRKPRQIQARLTRRDQGSTSDWVHVWLATQGGERTAYRFSVNAAGVQQDARLLDGSNEDVAYDAVWDAAVRVHRQGWTAEVSIPFRQIFYTPHAPQLRVQVGRVLARKRETSFLFPYPRSATQPVRYFGALRGLRDLPAPVHAELLPYARGGFRLEEGRRTAELAFGGDAILGLSPALSLSLTLNPDFGEVEADPSELNLTERETYLTERRPFFLHGKETVDYTLRYNNQRDTLYYSRRIGQQPQVSLDVDDEDILDYPRETRILAATRLAGTTSDNVSVGMVQAVTAREHARVQTPEGVRELPVAPPTNLGVARVTKELGGGRTVLGGMVTGVSRSPGAELDSDLPHSAATGGLDFQHREGEMVVLGKWFASHVAGSTESVRRLQESSVMKRQSSSQRWRLKNS